LRITHPGERDGTATEGEDVRTAEGKGTIEEILRHLGVMFVEPYDKTGDRECRGVVAATGDRGVGVMKRGCAVRLR